MSIRIRIISNGDERYHEIRDHETVVVVGRKDQCDIVLDEQRSSRQHFQIEKSGNGYQLVDLDSANGTRLNGKPVKKHALKLGDKIEVGSTVIWFGEPVPVKKVPTRRSAVTPSSAVRSAVPASASSSSGRRSSDVSITTIERRAEMEALRAGGLGSPRFIKNMFVAATALLVLSIGGVVMFKAMNPPPAPDSDGAMADSQSNLNDKRNASAKQQARDEFFAIADGPDDLETKIARLGKVVDKYVTEPFGAELVQEKNAFLASIGEQVKRDLERVFGRTLADRTQHHYGEAWLALVDFSNKYDRFQYEVWAQDYQLARATVQQEADDFFNKKLADMARADMEQGRYDDARAVYERAKSENFAGFRTMIDLCNEHLNVVAALERSKDTNREQVQRELDDASRRARLDRAQPQNPTPGSGSGTNNGQTGSQPEPEGVVKRTDEQRLLDQLHQKFLDACNKANGQKLKSGKIMLRGDEVPISGASAERGIKVYVQANEIIIKWDRVKPEMQLSGYRDIAKATVEDHWAMAIFAMRNGMNGEAEAICYMLLQEHPELKGAIDVFVSRVKSVPVPDNGGFVAWKDKQGGRFITPGERDDYEVAQKIDELVDTIGDNIDSSSSRSKERVQQAVEELSKYGVDARRRGVEVIEKKKEKLMDAIAKKGFGENGQLDDLKKQLDDARKEAMRVIFDKTIYPDEDHGRVGQPTVDEAVDKVKAIWNDPGSQVAIPGNIQKDVDAVKDLMDVAKQIDPDGQAGAQVNEQEFLSWVRSLANSKLSIQNYSKDSGERARYAEAAQIEKDNNEGDSPATAEERKHVSIVNAYRVMMGLGAVRINPKLTISARRHSEYLKSSGQFAHVVPGHPDGENPSARAQKQGYSGGGWENIAMSGGGHTPQSAFTAWYNSSGHHRNMLTGSHKVMGAGSAGSHWTQQFGNHTDGSEPKAPGGN